MRRARDDKFFYFVLNITLREQNEQNLKASYFYLRFTALDFLPSTHLTFNQELVNDFAKNYSEGKVFVCWEFLFIAAFQSKQVFDQKKKRENSLQSNVTMQNILNNILSFNQKIKFFSHQ